MNCRQFTEAEIPETLGFPPLIMKNKSRKVLSDLLSKETMAELEAADPLYLAGMEPSSITDGPGIRMAIFCQGCPHHCPGCHNPQTHAFEGGEPTSLISLLERALENPLLAGFTFSGGEPFAQARTYALLGKAAKELGYSVVTYTGYLLEDLYKKIEENKRKDAQEMDGCAEENIKADVEGGDAASIQALLSCTDVLIDGPFVLAKRNLELTFRGSDNQRIWVKKVERLE